MNDTRNTDVGAIRKEGMAYIIPIANHPTPTVTQLHDKIGRGFYNLVTARMLVPIQQLPDNDEDPEKYALLLPFPPDSSPINDRYCRDVRDN